MVDLQANKKQNLKKPINVIRLICGFIENNIIFPIDLIDIIASFCGEYTTFYQWDIHRLD